MTAWDSDWRIAQNFFWVIRRLGIFPAHAKFMTFRLFFLFAFTVYVESVFAVEKPLPRSTPEAQGVSSAAICAFVEAANTSIKTLHSFMMVRHGKVIAEGWWKPESAEKPHVLWSLSKSFAATAVGLAVADGKLGLDDPVLKFFPEFAPPEPSEHLKAMRVRHLLSMSGGHETEPKFSIEKRAFRERVSRSSSYTCAGHVVSLQYAEYLHVLGDCEQSDRAHCVGVSQATPI